MLSRLLVLPLAAVAGAGLVATASASAAQEEYPPAGPMLTASATAVACGSGVTLNGQDFEPGENVLISTSLAPLAAPSLERDRGGTGSEVAAQPLAYAIPAVYTESAAAEVAPAMAAPAAAAAQPEQEVTADGDGAFTTTLPLTEVGVATITATGQTSGLTASVVITVLPECPGAGPLPKTGNSGWPLVRMGVAAVGLGGLLLVTTLIWRSRRNRAGT